MDTGEKRSERQKALTGEAELVRDIVKAFVFRPEHVDVTSSGSGGGQGSVTILTLQVHGEDYGAVVGKMGRKMQALRTITQLLGMKEQREFRLILPERDRSEHDDYAPAAFEPNLRWDPKPTETLLRRLLDRVLSLPYEVVTVQAAEQTHLEISPAESEQEWLSRIQPYIHTVFHAIGKSEGHELYVDVQPIAVTK
jgi:predicted RNA-binding protein YlqC (UPF0109 family)